MTDPSISALARLVADDQQDGRPPWVKDEQAIAAVYGPAVTATLFARAEEIAGPERPAVRAPFYGS